MEDLSLLLQQNCFQTHQYPCSRDGICARRYCQNFGKDSLRNICVHYSDDENGSNQVEIIKLVTLYFGLGCFSSVWPLAVITEVQPGLDGQVRTVTLRSSKGTYKRPVVKLVLLVPEKDYTSSLHPGEDVQANIAPIES